MRTLALMTLGVAIFSGCNSSKLDKTEAKLLIQKEREYPQTLSYDIFCSDPVYAKKMIDAGLEEEGLVIVDRTQKLKDIGNPLIRFTDEAKPYLLPTPEKDKAIDIQKVKIATEELVGISDIAVSDDNSMRL